MKFRFTRLYIYPLGFMIFFILPFISPAQYDTKSLIRSGLQLIQDEEYEEAIIRFNKVIYVKPYLFEPYFYRGYSKFALGDYIGAEEDFNKALHVNPFQSEAFRFRGITRGKLKDYNRAILDFDQGIRLDTFNVYLYLNRAAMNIDMENYHLAVIDCNTAISLKPGEVDAYITRGTAYYLMDQLKEAMADFSKAIDIKPGYDLSYIKRGLVYYEEEKYKKAIRDFDVAAKISPGRELIYFYRAFARSGASDYAGALEDYNKVLALNPENALTYFNRAALHAETGALDAAVEDYNRVIALRPNHILSYYNRAGLFLQKKEYQKAIRDYSAAIDYFPDFPGAYINRSSAKEALGDREGAVKDYNTGMQILQKFKDQQVRNYFNEYADTNRYFKQLITLDADFESYSHKKQRIQDRFIDINILPFFKLSLKTNEDTYPFSGGRFNYYLEQLTGMEAIDTLLTFTNRIKMDNLHHSIPDYDLSLYKDEIKYLIAGITNQDMQNYNTAKQFLDQSIAMDTTLTASWFCRAGLELEIDEFLAKFSASNSMISMSGPAALHNNNDDEGGADLRLASHDLNMTLRIHPEFSIAHYNLGNLNCIQGNFSAAISNYTRAITLEKEFAEAFYNRGLVNIYLQQNAEGCNDLSKAGELGIREAYIVIKRFCN